ncbi:MAG: ROK family protein [Propionicimonas sp.]|uniref:ROK family protein n=1 Tax=Propionicimonas sp. TaxID=1955623 RepID=UPI002B20FD64|nr:ROK family protein [Propionicimonas sp.]MEA4943825.1 ROK family protein [Propionicimonas sp.]MEA5052086.1 ROK family protein [Propionicimonas sp.]MEA5119248.1 ROK family protein [Propionicimonas sp.]
MPGWENAPSSAHIQDVRERNLALVLAAVQRRGAASLGELADDTDLVPGAINKLVSQLFDLGFLIDHSTRGSGRRGRPERILTIGDSVALAVGIDVNTEGIAIRVEQLSGKLLGSVSLAAPGRISLQEIGRRSADALYSLLNTQRGIKTPLAMTVALPSLVANGIINSPSRGWHRVSTTVFSDAFDLQIRSFEAVNDGVAAVTAEYWASGRARYSSLALLHGTDGIAGGVIDHGSRVGGWEGAAGSFGHIVVKPNGHLCPCGQHGCLWRYASVEAIARAAGLNVGQGYRPLLDVAKELAELARSGEPQTLQALASAKHYIQRAIAILGPVVSPEQVVVSGNLVPLFDWIVPDTPARGITDGMLINWERPVIRSDFGTESVVVGAAWLSRRAILNTPLHWRPTDSGGDPEARRPGLLLQPEHHTSPLSPAQSPVEATVRRSS